MFAIGVMLAELLSPDGQHPAGVPSFTINKWDDRKYGRWASEGTRILSDIMPIAIASLIRDCLAANPHVRPSPVEVIDRICPHVGAAIGYDLRGTLALWAQEARGNNNAAHEPWAVEVAGELGGGQLSRSIADLDAIAVEPSAEVPGLAARWLTASCALGRLLCRRDEAEDRRRASAVAQGVLEFLVDHFDKLDLRSALYADPFDGHLLISDLEKEEVTIGFAQQALAVLTALGKHDDPAVRRLRESLDQRWQTTQPTIAELLRRFQLDPG